MPVTNYIWDVENDSYLEIDNDSYPDVQDHSYLMETDESDVTTAVYTNEPGEFGSVVSQRRGSTTNAFHYDGLGSTKELTDTAETVTDTYIYSAFGETVSETGTTINPFRWIGEKGYYYNSETDDYYVRERVYAPVIARWTSIDPLWINVLQGEYLYVLNNAINANDPSGYFFWFGRPPHGRPVGPDMTPWFNKGKPLPDCITNDDLKWYKKIAEDRIKKDKKILRDALRRGDKAGAQRAARNIRNQLERIKKINRELLRFSRLRPAIWRCFKRCIRVPYILLMPPDLIHGSPYHYDPTDPSTWPQA